MLSVFELRGLSFLRVLKERGDIRRFFEQIILSQFR